MRIYARSPLLAFVSGVAGIIVQTSVVVQEIMAQVAMLVVVLHGGHGVGPRFSVGNSTTHAWWKGCLRFPLNFVWTICWDSTHRREGNIRRPIAN